MKLRVRSLDGGDTLRIDLPSNGTSLQSLKEAVAHKINSSPTEVNLSLNKKDYLQGPPEESLQSLGIIAGDLVFYTLNPNDFQNLISPVAAENLESSKRPREKEVNTNPKNPRNPQSPNDKNLTLRELCASAAMKRASKDSATDNQNPAEIAVGTPKEQESGESMEVDDQILEKSRSIPYFLERVLSGEKENEGCGHGLLTIAVHAVMLESGFVGFNTQSSEASLGTRLPHGWAKKPLVSLCYTLPELIVDNSHEKYVENVQLRFSVMGNFLVVYGALASAKGSHFYRISLEVGKFLPSIERASSLIGKSNIVSEIVGETLDRKSEIGKAQDSLQEERFLFEFWKVVKDALSMPLLSALCEKAGLPLPPSLILLPTEVKMLILEKLPAVYVARLGCVCTEFRFLALNDGLWKQKYLDEFGSSGTQGVQRFKDAFVKKWIERKSKNQRRAGPLRYPSRPLLMRLPYPYGAPGYGIRGGDFDRFPAIGGGSLFGVDGIGGRVGLGGGSLIGGLPSRRLTTPYCDLNGFVDDIDGHVDPHFQPGRD
ncbi:hypothetical protein SUGI_0238790 [Cryptomeria japonica]|uniref:F-box protein SKIP22 n=1 Tax=Cryptomeria japonica TaxID=3369 RepID=UPI002408E68A|nr:F-box protein SKIP22 [Cryptomeria japonica]GLJ14732.1 hypothetical protein SUGI_0238790 [Cryptomeria japonica]